jgi:putative endopeptidase
MNKFVPLFLMLIVSGACNRSDSPGKSFVDVAGLDARTKPGDNFFRYVNGIWYDTAKIADDQSGVGCHMFLNIPQKKAGRCNVRRPQEMICAIDTSVKIQVMISIC